MYSAIYLTLYLTDGRLIYMLGIQIDVQRLSVIIKAIFFTQKHCVDNTISIHTHTDYEIINFRRYFHKIKAKFKNIFEF